MGKSKSASHSRERGEVSGKKSLKIKPYTLPPRETFCRKP
ncbi:hypothetical protein C789_1277 [Microcystis aeruginosa FACHB-905 = DIANCHI905]|nr:hypothetical protein C789_1277 [Microcystis aeruginosa FACHB-905 = DIANCHI905]